MFKSKFLNYLLIMVLGVLVVTSCTKENITDTKTNQGEIDPPVKTERNTLMSRSNSNSQTNGLDFDCFFVLYPFDLIDDGGTTYTINDDTDFETLFLDSSTYIIDFVYPLTLEFEDGTQQTANDGNELGEAFASCLPNGWTADLFPAYVIDSTNSCLTLVYPITVQEEDGTTAVAQSETELINLISQELYFFVFPFDLDDYQGNTVTVNNADELFIALASCGGGPIDSTYYGNGFEYLGCYELEFPFSVQLIDGTVEVVEDHMEYCDLLLEGKVNGFAFPLDLKKEDGTIVTATSQQELDQLLMDCGGFPPVVNDLFILYAGTLDSAGIQACWSINFPIDTKEYTMDGNEIQTLTFTSIEQIEALNFGGFYGIVYPVGVTYLKDNTIETFNNLEDLFMGLTSCQ